MISTSHRSPRAIEYLFIDGAYLRKCLGKWSASFFENNRIGINFQRLSSTSSFQKVFYYDCLSAKKENKEEYEKRMAPQQDFFVALKELSGFHVYEGTTSGTGGKARQKQIDIMIAVQMLSHTIRGNMSKATLLAGDLDFKPLLDALVQEGMYVTIWCEKNSTSRELVYAADARRDLDILSVWNFTTTEFQKKYPRLKAFSQPTIKTDETKSLLHKGNSPGGEVNVFEKNNGDYLIVYPDTNNKRYYIHWEHSNLELIKKTLSEYGITFEK